MKLADFTPDSYYIHSRYLSLFRIIYCLVTVFVMGLNNFVWLADSIDFFFIPPRISLANLFNGFPSKTFFEVLTIINLLSFFLMFWGIYSIWSSVTFGLSSIMGHNFIYSLFKIDHTLLYFITPLFLAFAGWGNYYSFDYKRRKKRGKIAAEQKERNEIIINLFAISIGFAMFTSGVQKLMGGWLYPGVEAVKGHLFNNYFAIGRDRFLAGYFLNMENHFAWKLQDYSTVFFEIGFLFSTIRRRIFSYFVAIGVFFHAFIVLSFNIVFMYNIIAYAVFFNWGNLDAFIRSKKELIKFIHDNKRNIEVGLLIFSIGVLILWLEQLYWQNNLQLFPSLLSFLIDRSVLLPVFTIICPLFVVVAIYLRRYKTGQSIEKITR